MRKSSVLTTAAAIVASAAIATSAGAQEVPDIDMAVDVKATPSKAGTKQNPRGVAFSGTAKIATEPGFDPPIMTGLDLLVGRGIVYNGDDYVRCSKRILDRRGLDGCPRKSIVGNATGTARADTIVTHPDVVVVNGGSKRLLAYTTLYHPALVRETIVVKTEKMSGQWAYRDTLRIPESLQIVAGVPIQMTGVKFTLGGKPYAKKLMTTTSCPKGGWKYRAKTYFLFDQTGETATKTIDGSVPCRS